MTLKHGHFEQNGGSISYPGRRCAISSGVSGENEYYATCNLNVFSAYTSFKPRSCCIWSVNGRSLCWFPFSQSVQGFCFHGWDWSLGLGWSPSCNGIVHRNVPSTIHNIWNLCVGRTISCDTGITLLSFLLLILVIIIYVDILGKSINDIAYILISFHQTFSFGNVFKVVWHYLPIRSHHCLNCCSFILFF